MSKNQSNVCILTVCWNSHWITIKQHLFVTFNPFSSFPTLTTKHLLNCKSPNHCTHAQVCKKVPWKAYIYTHTFTCLSWGTYTSAQPLKVAFSGSQISAFLSIISMCLYIWKWERKTTLCVQQSPVMIRIMSSQGWNARAGKIRK